MEERNECSAGVSRAIFLLLMEIQDEKDMKLIFYRAWSLLGAALGKEKALYSIFNAITGILQHSPLLIWFLCFVIPRAQGALTDTPKPQNKLGMTSLGCVPPKFWSYPPTPNNSRSQGLSLLPKSGSSPAVQEADAEGVELFDFFTVYISANKGISVHRLHVT